MRKSIKNFIVTFTLAISILQIATIVFAKIDIPTATTDFYVNDFAEVFSLEEKTRLMSNAVKLSDESDGIQVVLTTIKSLDGNSIDDYSISMYNNYGIGKNDMGILILLSTEDREIRIQIGRAMEAYITDSKAGRILDKYAVPYLKENRFNAALVSLQEALIDEINTSISKENTLSVSSNSDEIDFSLVVLPLLFGLLILAILFLILFFIKNSIKKYNIKKQKISNLEEELKKSQKALLNERQNSLKSLNNIKNVFQKEKEDLLLDSMKKQDSIKSSYMEKISNLESQIQSLSSQKDMLFNNYNQLEKKYSTLLDRYNRGCKLYQSLDTDISQMIEDEIIAFDKKKASEFDSTASSLISLSANKDLLDKLNNILSFYKSLNDNQKSYVKTDIKKIDSLYSESYKLKKEYEQKLKEEQIRKQEAIDKKNAKKAFDSINSAIIGISIAKAANLKVLENAKTTYQNLSSGELKYFDNSILTRLYALLNEAEKDYEHEQKIAKNKKVADNAVNSITSIIASMSYGKASYLSQLNSAKSIYDNLSVDEQRYFDKGLLNKLNKLIEESKRDKRNEEEKRRNNHMMNSSFNHHNNFRGSSGGFRGHGGISSGGGASRKF